VRALEDGRTKWLVWAGVCVGLAFETKMLVALMIVPGIAAAWLWIAPRGRVAAFRSLLAGGAAMVVVGGAWPLLVALTPASDRPWISGTADNSIWSLIFGYNGFNRIEGQAGGPQAFGGGGPFGGSSGSLRLLNDALGGQAGWFLGVALVSAIALIAATRLRRSDARSGWLIAVGGSFAVTALAFSFAQGIFHPYYVSLLAPYTAALVGAGAVVLFRSHFFAPLAVAAGVLTELTVLHNGSGGLDWLEPVLVVGGGVVVLVLTIGSDRVRAAALACALALLMIAPATWSFQTLGHATSGTFPAGGTASASFGGPGGGGGPPGGDQSSLTEALAYAEQNGGGTIGVSSQMSASSPIISSGANVAALGGFSGRESEVSVKWLAQAVKSGQIRYVLTDGGGFAGPGNDSRVGSSKLMAAVAATCKKTSVSGLYDCRGSASALAGASQ
jgi:4-amino-4-deoxy-L-arabinose transferase-like glycosyltransferase